MYVSYDLQWLGGDESDISLYVQTRARCIIKLGYIIQMRIPEVLNIFITYKDI